MSGKARHFDYSPDEYISGVAGRLRADEQGVYWMICSLIMSEGGPVDYDERRLATLCMLRPAHIRRIINRLVQEKKLTRSDGKLGQKRAQSEVERASNRIQSAVKNGAKGGRPAEKPKQNQQKAEPEGLISEKLSLTSNEQRATNKKKHYAPSPKASGASNAKYPPPFETLWLAYRPIGSPNSTKADAHKAWGKLSPEEQDACLAGMHRYVAWLSEEKQSRNDTKAKHLATFINKRGWEPFLEGATLISPIADEHPNIPPERLAEIQAEIEREFGGRRIR
jgi:uncharacterized protein YdaU (DUF1376 family)